MTILLLVLLAAAIIGCLTLLIAWLRQQAATTRLETTASELQAAADAKQRTLEVERDSLRTQNARLAVYAGVADAEDKAREITDAANARVAQAENDARILVSSAEQHYAKLLADAKTEAEQTTDEARAKARRLNEEAQSAIAAASARSAEIIEDANKKAEAIAGSAYDAVRDASRYEKIAKAMKNVIEGYGDEYLVPPASLLDDLGEEFSHKEAGQRLKLARQHTKVMIKQGTASRCDYVESNRRERAEAFVLDAFNGKVDSILSRVRHDNVGKLAEEIRDAFTLVNHGGEAFRNARITDEYVNARLQELEWGAIAQELKRQLQEEQRQIREQIREEAKAQREFERAMRDAAKEEEALRKAMAKAEVKIAQATDEQRVEYERQLAELNERLRLAEERNQRAVSMAQQTRRGHVYIISNVGSFGEHIYKIGLTRRLDPMDRIWELGDSSVPFDFDVHAMLLSDDAPALECQLHKKFVLSQVNKVNHRKEFFKANLQDLRREIEALGLEVKWTMLGEATEFRETLAIERAIASDPIAREKWLNRQLTLDPTDYREMSSERDEEEMEVASA